MNVDDWNGDGPLPMLYAKAATGTINQWLCWVQGDTVWVEWGQMEGALQQKGFKCAPKNTGRSNATTAEEQAIKEAIAKWKKQRKKKYFLTPEDAEGTLNLKPMLAKGFKDMSAKAKRELVWPVHVQPKYDGRRCMAYRKDGQVFLQSRGGDPYHVPHIEAALEKCLVSNVVLDGELYHHGTSLQMLGSWVDRLQYETRLVEYHVYDITDLRDQSDVWSVRKDKLYQWFWQNIEHVDRILYQVQSYECANEAEVKAAHDLFVQEGFEGAIIRATNVAYRFGYRSPGLLKYKNFQDSEFRIISWTTGKPGSDWENVPVFRCVTAEGKEFDVAPKGSMQVRAMMLAEADSYVGKMMTVRYFDLTDDGIPHFPVGIAIREPGT